MRVPEDPLVILYSKCYIYGMIKPVCPEDWLESTSTMLKVCGHPLRLKLLILMEREQTCVSDLWQCVGESQPVVSQHLALLKEKGIVEARAQGNKRVYYICDEDARFMIHSLYLRIPQDHIE